MENTRQPELNGIFSSPVTAEEKLEIVNRFSNLKGELTDVSVTDDSFFTASGFSSGRSNKKVTNYSKEEALEILESGSDIQLRQLSESFYYSSGFYRRLLTYYATILYYTPVVIPRMIGRKKKITDKKYGEKHFQALDFVNDLNFEQLCRHFALSTLKYGAYYGMLKETGGNFVVQDLPYSHCRSRLKSYTGVDIVEFNVEWFDTIKDADLRKETLNNFPKEIKKAYLSKGKKGKWVRLPVEQGIHFTLYEDKPFFSTVIPAIIDSQAYIELEKVKDGQQMRSVAIQEIDHTSNGDLVLEPEESVELHKGLTKITQNNPYLDGITTYGKIKIERVLDDETAQKDNVEKMSKIMYSESGTSKQIFSAEGNVSLERSIQNDISTIFPLAEQFAIWLKCCLNHHFADNNMNFSVKIFPVGQYNFKDYSTQVLSMAQYGYSAIIPAMALGLRQDELLDLKELENNIYKLSDVLIPLHSSYTETQEEETQRNGAKNTEAEVKKAQKDGASKAEENRSEKTIKNRESSVGGE